MPNSKEYIVNVRRYKRPDGKFQNRITAPVEITSGKVKIIELPNVFKSKKRYYDKD